MRSSLLILCVFYFSFACYGAYAEDSYKRPSCKYYAMHSNLDYVNSLNAFSDAYEHYVSSIENLNSSSQNSKFRTCGYLKLLDYKINRSVKNFVGCDCCLITSQDAYPVIILYKDGKEVYRTGTDIIRETYEIINTAYK